MYETVEESSTEEPYFGANDLFNEENDSREQVGVDGGEVDDEDFLVPGGLLDNALNNRQDLTPNTVSIGRELDRRSNFDQIVISRSLLI